MNKMQLYYALPVWAQNLACYMEGIRIQKSRYSKTFWTALKEYKSHNAWGYDRLCGERDAKLGKMVRHCYTTVPCYKKCFDEGGINPDSIKTIDDLKILPILTKDQVKANINDFVSTGVDYSKTKIHPTGGTTGAGLRFVTTNEEEAEQWAIWWRYRLWHGIGFETWCGNLGGKATVPLTQKEPPFWRKNTPGRQFFYSGYHINKENAEYYAKHIQKNNIRWIHGYPSNLAEFASYLNENGITLPLQWVSIGAENLYPKQIAIMEKVYCTKPIQHYGLTEGVANISERPNGELTVDEDFACVEFLPTGNANEYRIIGTTLTNFAMPLLRYDTGDLAYITELGKHNEFGRVIDRLNGRQNEFVQLPNGAKVGAAAISLITNRFQGVMQSQIIQHTRDKIDFCIVVSKTEPFSEDEFRLAIQEKLGTEMQVNIVQVDSLIKTTSGKQKLVISEIN